MICMVGWWWAQVLFVAIWVDVELLRLGRVGWRVLVATLRERENRTALLKNVSPLLVFVRKQQFLS